MERLQVGMRAPHDPTEAALHAGRYVLALPFVRGRRVLDLGCGQGRGAWLMAEAGAAEVLGVDIAAEAIATAEATFRNPALRFRCMAVEDLADMLPAGHFDMVVMIDTLEHVEDPRRCLRALHAVARPGALIVIACSNDSSSHGGAHQRRRFGLVEFQAMTTEILGDAVQWLASPAPGCAAVPPSSDPGAPSPETGDHICGVWNAPVPLRAADAAYGMPMDADVFPAGPAGPRPGLRQIEAEMDRIFRANDAGRAERDALATSLAEAEGRCASLKAELDAERRSREIIGVQAAVLRREIEILAAGLRLREQELERVRAQSARAAALEDSVAWHVARVEALEAEAARHRELEGSLAWHVARVQALQEEAARHLELENSLAWHVARVKSLDEALAWHIARVEALEAESVRQLLRRLSSRALRRAPMLARIADRLRGRA